jgi:hypothetical protein
MAPPLPEGAARAVRKRIGAPDRQRDGQGHRLGVPLAGDAGERHARDYREIAAAETINESYVGRVLRLTLLAPDIAGGLLRGRQPAALQLEDLLRRFPVGWQNSE